MSSIQEEDTCSLQSETQPDLSELQEKIGTFSRTDLQDLVEALFRSNPDMFVQTATAFIRRPKPVKPTKPTSDRFPLAGTQMTTQTYATESTPAATSPDADVPTTPCSSSILSVFAPTLTPMSGASVAATPTLTPMSGSSVAATPTPTHPSIKIPSKDVTPPALSPWARDLPSRFGTAHRSINSNFLDLPNGNRTPASAYDSSVASPNRRFESSSSCSSPWASPFVDLKIASSRGPSLLADLKNASSTPDLKLAANDPAPSEMTWRRVTSRARRLRGASVHVTSQDGAEDDVISPTSDFKSDSDSDSDSDSAPGSDGGGSGYGASMCADSPSLILLNGRPLPSDVTLAAATANPDGMDLSRAGGKADIPIGGREACEGMTSRHVASAICDRPLKAASHERVASSHKTAVTSRPKTASLHFLPAVGTTTTTPPHRNPHRTRDVTSLVGSSSRDMELWPSHRRQVQLGPVTPRDVMSCESSSGRSRKGWPSDVERGNRDARSLAQRHVHPNALLNVLQNLQERMNMQCHVQDEVDRLMASANGNGSSDQWSKMTSHVFNGSICSAPRARDTITRSRPFSQISGLQPREFYEAVLVHPFFALEALHQQQLQGGPGLEDVI